MLLMAKIMVAEDQNDLVEFLRDVLEMQNHQVVATASNGEEAVEVFNKAMPDILFLDIAMPKKDGKAALAEIMVAHPDAKVVMVTALDDMDTIQECSAKGAVAYIVKPFNIDDINRAISVALN